MSVKDFKEEIASTINNEDTHLERSAMDGMKLSSEMDITQETLTELQDVCRYSNYHTASINIDTDLHHMLQRHFMVGDCQISIKI